MSATATVEEYHPEVVAFARELAWKLGRATFIGSFEVAANCVFSIDPNFLDSAAEELLTQFLLSHCAKPRQQTGAAQ